MGCVCGCAHGDGLGAGLWQQLPLQSKRRIHRRPDGRGQEINVSRNPCHTGLGLKEAKDLVERLPRKSRPMCQRTKQLRSKSSSRPGAKVELK